MIRTDGERIAHMRPLHSTRVQRSAFARTDGAYRVRAGEQSKRTVAHTVTCVIFMETSAVVACAHTTGHGILPRSPLTALRIVCLSYMLMMDYLCNHDCVQRDLV